MITEPAGNVKLYAVPPIPPCLTNITPVSPVLAFDIDSVLFPPNVTFEFEPLFKFHVTVAASVKACCSI